MGICRLCLTNDPEAKQTSTADPTNDGIPTSTRKIPACLGLLDSDSGLGNEHGSGRHIEQKRSQCYNNHSFGLPSVKNTVEDQDERALSNGTRDNPITIDYVSDTNDDLPSMEEVTRRITGSRSSLYTQGNGLQTKKQTKSLDCVVDSQVHYSAGQTSSEAIAKVHSVALYKEICNTDANTGALISSTHVRPKRSQTCDFLQRDSPWPSISMEQPLAVKRQKLSRPSHDQAGSMRHCETGFNINDTETQVPENDKGDKENQHTIQTNDNRDVLGKRNNDEIGDDHSEGIRKKGNRQMDQAESSFGEGFSPHQLSSSRPNNSPSHEDDTPCREDSSNKRTQRLRNDISPLRRFDTDQPKAVMAVLQDMLVELVMQRKPTLQHLLDNLNASRYIHPSSPHNETIDPSMLARAASGLRAGVDSTLPEFPAAADDWLSSITVSYEPMALEQGALATDHGPHSSWGFDDLVDLEGGGTADD